MVNAVPPEGISHHNKLLWVCPTWLSWCCNHLLVDDQDPNYLSEALSHWLFSSLCSPETRLCSFLLMLRCSTRHLSCSIACWVGLSRVSRSYYNNWQVVSTWLGKTPVSSTAIKLVVFCKFPKVGFVIPMRCPAYILNLDKTVVTRVRILRLSSSLGMRLSPCCSALPCDK